jgi:hypothetical protein
LSTFSTEELQKVTLNNGYYVVKTLKVPIVKLGTIFQKYMNGASPDLLSIDVEGLDFDIITSLDFDIYKPNIICIEAAEYSPIGSGKRNSKLIDFILNKGYYEYANTNLNSILVRNEFWFL